MGELEAGFGSQSANCRAAAGMRVYLLELVELQPLSEGREGNGVVTLAAFSDHTAAIERARSLTSRICYAGVAFVVSEWAVDGGVPGREVWQSHNLDPESAHYLERRNA